MEIFYIFPSANVESANRCCDQWKSLGYKTAVYFDSIPDGATADHVIGAPYAGYYRAISFLAALANADIVICGGDDISPDPNTGPEIIAAQFLERFPDLYGVMQPTGDLGGDGKPFGGTGYAAVSPWIGRGWIERAYGGNGPHWTGYRHCYGDGELRDVAIREGVYWERPDLCQYHAHYSRGHTDNLPPELRKRIHRDWPADKALYERRKAANFPGSEPLAK